MFNSVCRNYCRRAMRCSALSRVHFASRCIIALVVMLLVLPNSASSETASDFTSFRFVSPKAREITVPDTATMDEVLDILRSNNVPFNGPQEIFIDDGKGGQVVGVYKVILELITYDPRGTTSPHCPYKQTTTMWYDGTSRRLQHYTVVLLVTCVK
jgi:hypothetical protein